MPVPSGPAVSRWADVHIAAACRLLSSAGMFGVTTAFMLSLQSAGAGGIAASALVVISAVPVVVLAPLTGRLVDRADSRLLITSAALVQTAACASIAYADGSLAALYALAALMACAQAVLLPSFGALIPSMVRREDMPRASATVQSCSSVGMLLGPVLAGSLMDGLGLRASLLVSASLVLATALGARFIRTRRGRRTFAGTAPARWRLGDDGLVRVTIVGLALVVTFVAVINLVGVFFTRETLGASETLYGFVAAAWPAGMLAGGWLLAGRIRAVADDAVLVRWVFVTLTLTSGVLLLASGVFGPAWWLIPLWIAGGSLNGSENVMINVLIARRVPDAARGRAIATLQACVQGCSLAGYIAGGVLLEVAAPRVLVLGAGLGGLLVLGALFPVIRRALARARRGDPSIVDERVPAAVSG